MAPSIGAASVLGANLAGRVGTRPIVMTGLTLLGGSFLWISQIGATIPDGVVVLQMVMMGTGLAPALHLAQSSVGAGYAVAREVPAVLHPVVLHSVQTAFLSGLRAGCIVAAE